MDAIRELRELGGVARAGELTRRGVSPGLLRALSESGTLWRPRKGWYVLPECGRDVARAVRVGGQVACVSAAAHHGLWVPDVEERLHVAVDPRIGRLRGPDDRRSRWEPGYEGVAIHWSRHSAHAVQPIGELIAEVARCVGPEDAFAVLESALRTRKLRRSDLPRLRDALTHPLQRLLPYSSQASGSGSESHFKLLLLELGLPFRQQVEIPRVGRVDFVVGDDLIVEVDSRQHHADIARDRRRDAEASAAGYRSMHVLYGQVMYERDLVRRALIGSVVRGDTIAHRRSA